MRTITETLQECKTTLTSEFGGLELGHVHGRAFGHDYPHGHGLPWSEVSRSPLNHKQSSYSKVIEKEYHDLKVKKTFDCDGDSGGGDDNW